MREDVLTGQGCMKGETYRKSLCLVVIGGSYWEDFGYVETGFVFLEVFDGDSRVHAPPNPGCVPQNHFLLQTIGFLHSIMQLEVRVISSGQDQEQRREDLAMTS